MSADDSQDDWDDSFDDSFTEPSFMRTGSQKSAKTTDGVFQVTVTVNGTGSLPRRQNQYVRHQSVPAMPQRSPLPPSPATMVTDPGLTPSTVRQHSRGGSSPETRQLLPPADRDLYSSVYDILQDSGSGTEFYENFSEVTVDPSGDSSDVVEYVNLCNLDQSVPCPVTEGDSRPGSSSPDRLYSNVPPHPPPRARSRPPVPSPTPRSPTVMVTDKLEWGNHGNNNLKPPDVTVGSISGSPVGTLERSVSDSSSPRLSPLPQDTGSNPIDMEIPAPPAQLQGDTMGSDGDGEYETIQDVTEAERAADSGAVYINYSVLSGT